MDRDGVFDPETIDEAAAAYETVGPAAQVAIKEAAKAMGFDADEYGRRVTGAVIETARDALFASLLVVYTGSRAEFESWCEDAPGYDRSIVGSESVPNVAWHPVPFEETVYAATYRNEPEAAAATLRRRVFGEVYRTRLEPRR